jgi:glycosyl transferase family 2
VTLVSVCIPTRNQARFLAAAIDSALAQDMPGLEVLVHDDASTDETPQLLAAVHDPRLRVVRHNRPLGVAGNRNTCLSSARGRYIAWLDSDDVYLPGSLAPRVALLEQHPRVGLVHAGFRVMDETGRPLRDWPAPADADSIQPGPVAFRQLITSNLITTSTVVVRRSAHRRSGGFSTTVGPSSSDWHMWLRIALRADVAYLTAAAARYRQHADTISRATAGGARLRCDRRVVDGVLRAERDRVLGGSETRAAAHAALAAKALTLAGERYTAGRRRQAMRAALTAARLAPAAPAGRQIAHLLVAIARGDDDGCYRHARAGLAKLADLVGPTPYGERLRTAAASDPVYEASLERTARHLRAATTADARVATVTKWDPTLLRLAGRRGSQFPDRRLLPDGYPRDGDVAVEQLELARESGTTHLAFTWATSWWLEHYPQLADHLAARYRLVQHDDDCVIYDLRR